MWVVSGLVLLGAGGWFVLTNVLAHVSWWPAREVFWGCTPQGNCWLVGCVLVQFYETVPSCSVTRRPPPPAQRWVSLRGSESRPTLVSFLNFCQSSRCKMKTLCVYDFISLITNKTKCISKRLLAFGFLPLWNASSCLLPNFLFVCLFVVMVSRSPLCIQNNSHSLLPRYKYLHPPLRLVSSLHASSVDEQKVFIAMESAFNLFLWWFSFSALVKKSLPTQGHKNSLHFPPK